MASVTFALAVMNDQKSILAGFRKNGTGNARRVCRLATSTAFAATTGGGGQMMFALATGDYLQAQVLHTDSVNRDTEYVANESIVTIMLQEIL